MISAPDRLIYIIVLIFGLFYAIVYYYKNRVAPSLTDVFIVITSVAAIHAGGELVLNIILNDSLDLGELKESQLIIILGGLAVVWVGGTSFFDTFQKIKNKN